MIWVRAPNHLGDGVMALPAVEALCREGEVRIGAPRWGSAVYGHLSGKVVSTSPVPQAEAAVLFPPSFRVAWEARRIPVRVGLRGDWRSWLLTHAIRSRPGHRSQEYAALADQLGASVDGPPCLPRSMLPADVPDGHLALAPVSPSGETVMWPHFEDLGRQWPGPVVVYLGPGEHWPTELPSRTGLPLDQLAACLQRARALVGNDSGLAHFARALGVPTVVLHGSTTASTTGPAGSLALEGPPLPCRPCYRKTCRIGGAPCLDISVERVQQALGEL